MAEPFLERVRKLAEALRVVCRNRTDNEALAIMQITTDQSRLLGMIDGLKKAAGSEPCLCKGSVIITPNGSAIHTDRCVALRQALKRLEVE